jgi:glycine/D-amino acid oxidase-like deaminating enzyme
VPLSYQLHADLAAEHGGVERWGYREVKCCKITATVRARDLANKGGGSQPVTPTRRRQSNGSTTTPATDGTIKQENHDSTSQPPVQKDWEKLPKQDEAASSMMRKSKLPADLDWIDAGLVREYAEMGQPGFTATAQVHPRQFTTAMAQLAQERGVHILLQSQVTAIRLNAAYTHVDSVEYIDRTAPPDTPPRALLGVTDVVVAAGPWSGRLVPGSAIEGLRAHSVVFAAAMSPYAVFTDIALPREWAPPHRAARGERRVHRGRVDPEVYARPGGEAYACGEPDPSAPLPATADAVACDDDQCDDLAAYFGTVSPLLSRAPVVARQACYIPRHMRAGEECNPLVGPTTVAGLWMASGHTCWGIQNGPATGKLISEFIFGGAARSVDVSELDPLVYGIGL